MPDKSRDDLVLRALRILGALPNGQTADDDDYDLVDGLVEPLIARMSEEEITTIDDPGTIPEAQFLDVAVLLAEAAMGDFGVAALPPPNDPRMSEVRIRTVVHTAATLETVETTDPDTGVDESYTQAETTIGTYF